MSGNIPFTKYVDITSGVAAGAAVAQRSLGCRIVTANPLVPPGTAVVFASADAVGAVFGTGSEEYKRAAQYFGWISKTITVPNRISFWRWVETDSAPVVYGVGGGQQLASWTAVTSGSLTVTLGEVTAPISGLNFASATSLSAVAAILQAALRSVSTGPLWTAATVGYDPLAARFVLTGGASGVNSLAIAAGTVGTDIAALAGWLSGATLCPGAAAETISASLAAMDGFSNDYGSFCFLTGLGLTLAQIVEAATWNATRNVATMFLVATAAATAAAWSAALMGLAGTALTLAGPAGEYHEMMPGMILAATAYPNKGCAQNYMYQQFGLTPTVTDGATSDRLDGLRVNYYGQTQFAGQKIAFYQRGTLMGPASAPSDQNSFGNEQWLKSAAAAAIMTLQLAVTQIPASAQGVAMLRSALLPIITQAIGAGVIVSGKPISVAQQLFITSTTGDPLAYLRVGSIGWWLGITLQSTVTSDGRTEWTAVYTLIYAKDDCIRTVDGTHALI